MKRSRAPFRRVLVDASTLIILGAVGRLDLLRTLFAEVHTTRVVENEATAGHHPETESIEAAVRDGWIRIVALPRRKTGSRWEELGLGPGEASLLEVSTPEDLLIFDDRNARQAAAARGLPHVGLLRVIVQAALDGALPAAEAKTLIQEIARSGFRMTVELYQWALTSIGGVGERKKERRKGGV